VSSRQAADSSSSERLRRHRAEALSWPLWFWEGWGQFVWGLVFRFPILGIVDSQTKNQAARRNIGQRDESEAGRKRVGSVIQKTDL
jgi:hypothetical protein